jgi:TIR domain
MKVFVSYSHQQGAWVRDALVPVLRASGADVLVDWERFKAGFAVAGQMDGTQDKADRYVLVITADYLASKYCVHEMDRAIRLDPGFAKGKIIPVKFDGTSFPPKITRPNPLHVDLRNAAAADQWQRLIRQCGGDLWMPAPAWIASLDKAKQHLERNECVNVVERGKADWRRWLDALRETRFAALAMVDLSDPTAYPRDRLIREILRVTNRFRDVPAPPYDLPVLGDAMKSGKRCHLALAHFYYISKYDYGDEFFYSLRYLISDAKRLVLLVHTRQPVSMLLPPTHEFSGIDFKTVELG